MASDGVNDEGDEEYLEKVVKELARREVRLALVDTDIATLRHRLANNGEGAAVRSGDVVRMRAEARYKKQLIGELERKETERERAFQEVKMARERRQMVEEEIAGKTER